MSPILFNIALEGLLRHLTSSKMGYTIADFTINSLAYADDVCIVASTKSDLQALLDRCVAFTEWAGLTFNAKKCGSLCMFNRRSPIYVDPLFSPRLGTDNISALAWGQRYKYLGSPTGANRLTDLSSLRTSLVNDANVVFQSPLAEWQKLDCFRKFLFPRVSFALRVVFPGPAWCKQLDSTLRGIIKKGLRLPLRACTEYFYLSQALGGMGIPSVADEAHVARAGQAFKFLADLRDPIVRSVALNQLAATVRKRAPELNATIHADLASFLNNPPKHGEGRAGDLHSIWSAMRSSLNISAATIALSANSATLVTSSIELGWQKRHLVPQLLKEGIAVRRLSAMTGHPDQGRAFHSLSMHPDSTFFTYTGAFLTFPQYRFVHKARLDLLPVRTVQARCRKTIPSTLCRVCGRFQETLAHVLNHCHPSMGLIRDRHNAILDRIIRAVPDSLGAKYKEQPLPGTSGNNRPDLTVIAPDDSYAIIVDVSCPFEGSPTALEEAAQAKLLKYEPLRHVCSVRYNIESSLKMIHRL